MKFKKPLKIIIGLVVFFTLPSLLFFGFVFFKYNQDLPIGIEGEQADAIAYKMLDALDYEAYKNTNYIEWTFKKRHHFKWQKNENTCLVFWKDFKVNLDLKNSLQSKAYVHKFKVDGEKAIELITEATKHFNNASFWLVAPYKIFDEGTKRSLVKTKHNEDALLVTYTTGGNTPGDSYLWFLNDTGKPEKFKMWTSNLPIDGLEATWEDWITTESGAQLPTFHKILVLDVDMGNIKGAK